jgi:surface antigen
VGDTTPSYTVDVAGDVNVTGAFRVNGTAVATTLDYAMAAKTASTTLAATGTDISGWGTAYLRGAIIQYSYTYFLLKAGKTYELECALKIYNWSSAGAARYAWVNDSNLLVGDVNVPGDVYPANFNSSEASQPVTKAVFTPAVDTYVKVRMTFVSGTVTVEAGSYVTIRQLP